MIGGQTSMRRYTDPARPGLIAAPIHLAVVLPTLAPVAGVNAGTFVARGAGSLCKAPTTGSEVTATGLGFVVADQSKSSIDTIAVDGGPDYTSAQECPVYAHGPGIWALCQEAMAVDDPVYIVTAATGRGQVRNDADTGNATLLPGARVRAVATTFAGLYLASIDTMASSVAGPTGPTGATGPTGPTGPTGA